MKKCLGFAIAGLLFEVRTGALAPVMPNECAGCECDPLPCLLQAPTYVHVVAGLAKLGIETLNLFEGVAVKGHIAAGDVLRQLIAFEDVSRLTGTSGYTTGQATIIRRQIWSANGCRIGTLQLMDQMREPIGVGKTIGVGIGHDLAGGCSQANVARDTEPKIRLMN